MPERQDKILKIIIEEYIKTARPVGSKILVEKYKLRLSSATIRSEMNKLEKRGFLVHPYTSAGRVPTAKSYQFYTENLLKEKRLSKTDQKFLSGSMADFSLTQIRNLFKDIAKRAAKLSGQAVIVGFGPQDTYYTGLSFLFKHPEFTDIDFLYNISEIVDKLDERIPQLFSFFEESKKDVKILIGDANPLSPRASIILARYQRQGILSGLFGILGPMRMDYGRNLAIIKYIMARING